MFAVLIKQNYRNLRLLTMQSEFRMLHRGLPNMKDKPTSKQCQEEHEEEDDEEYEEECEEETPQAQRACPPNPCKPQPVETPCLPSPTAQPLSAVGMPHVLGAIGAKQISVLFAFVPALLRYGVVALIGLIYMTEFKTVLQFLPFYNGKYLEDSDEIKPKAALQNDEELGAGGQPAKSKKDC